MALTSAGDIAYHPAPGAGVRYQTDPPVCNACEQAVTTANLGKMYLDTPQPHSPRGLYEILECATCVGHQADQRTRERFAAVHGTA